MTVPLDLSFVRQYFPAFSEESLNGWAFFENAGGSYACGPVIDRLGNFYRQTKVQPYCPYPASTKAGQEMDSSYELLAGYLNLQPDEIDFGPSTSQNTYVLAQAFRAGFVDGDEVIVSNQDHEANAGVWRRMGDEDGRAKVSVSEWRVDPTSGLLDPEKLIAQLNERTRLVVFPHCSNVIGHFNPVAEIVAAVKAYNPKVRVVVDGVSAAPHGLPDVTSLGADIYLFSLYKTFGPHLGLMAATREVRAELANQGHWFNAGSPHHTLTPAGPDHAQIAAAGGIIEYFDAVHAHHFDTNPDFDTNTAAAERGRQVAALFQAAETPLLDRLLTWLSERDDVRLVGPSSSVNRAATVALVPQAKPIRDVLESLISHKVMAADGNFYAQRPLDGIGISEPTGVLRLSFVHYTSSDEVEQLIAALDVAL